jgi:hypothetical protein
MPDQRPAPEPQLFRFGMRQLLWFVAGSAVLCGAFSASSGGWRIVIGTLAALVAAHVFGTAVGTRLRDTSADVRRWRAAGPASDRDEPVATPEPLQWAELALPAGTPLARCDAAPARSYLALAAGTLVGAAAGAAAVFGLVGPRITWPGAAVGVASCAIIGAWAALLAANFVTIARRTWRQAASDS